MVSVSASLDFDGPEESYLWDKSIDHAEEPVIIARPAQVIPMCTRLSTE